MKRTLIASALLTAGFASAQAADLPMKAPAPPPVAMAPVLNWSGFYIGVNGGYSWGRAGRQVTFFTAPSGLPIIPPVGSGTTADANLNGGLFGGQIGWNMQASSWLFGLEADWQWSGQRGSASALCAGLGACLPGVTALPAGAFGTTATVDQKLQWFGTVRGRAGVLVTPSALLYATGGLAYGSVKTDVGLATITATGVPLGGFGSSSDTKVGWTVGGGIEWMWTSGWSAKIEYLYMDLGSVTSTGTVLTSATTGIGATLTSKITDNIIRAGINYHFNWGPEPVVARY